MLQLLSLLFLLVSSLSAQAQERGLVPVRARLAPEHEILLYQGSYAVVVGVSDYTDWPDLPNAVGDAAEVAAALAALGFQVRVADNPDQQALEGLLKDLEFQQGMEQSRVLFYFAGHGETETLANGEELGYIVPRDAPLKSADPREFVDKAISMARIEQCAKRMRVKHALFIFDSCFSGSIFTLQRAAPQNISEKCALPVRQFITAGGKSETVPDQSVFRASLLKALRGEGDVTGDGYLTGTELGMYLQEKVVDYSRGAQHPQAGKLRDPELDQGDFVFVLPSSSSVSSPAIPAPSALPASVTLGHLQVDVNAPAAQVYVDGTRRGTAGPGSPLNLVHVSQGEVVVRVEAEGFASATQRCTLVPDQWTQTRFELAAMTSTPPPQPASAPAPARSPRRFRSAYSELVGGGLLAAGDQRFLHLTLLRLGYHGKAGPVGIDVSLAEGILHRHSQKDDARAFPDIRLDSLSAKEYDSIIQLLPLGAFVPVVRDGPFILTVFARAALVNVVNRAEGSPGDGSGGYFPPVIRVGLEWRSFLHSAWVGFIYQAGKYDRGDTWPVGLDLSGVAAEIHVGLGGAHE
jgi:uncharacterized caspase-like protein